MPLFRRRNKAGTAEGPVVESNPNVPQPRKTMSTEEMIAESNKRYQDAMAKKAAESKPVDEKRTPTEPITIITEHDRENLKLPSLYKGE